MSWRDEDHQNDSSSNSNNHNGIQAALPHVSTVMDTPKDSPRQAIKENGGDRL